MFNTAAAVEGSAVIHVLFPILVELKDAGGVRAIFFIRELSFLFYSMPQDISQPSWLG